MKPGTKVKVHYKGTFDDGTVFDSSHGKEPLEFTIGEKQVIPGFEDAVTGMKLNQEKTIKLKPEEAYGNRDDRLVAKIPRDKFPPEIQEGGKLILKGPEGQHLPAVIREVSKDIVIIDLNHPLAGKQLTFKVKVVGVN